MSGTPESMLTQIQAILKRSVEQICVHSSRMEARIVVTERSLRAIDSQITAFRAGRYSQEERDELVDRIKGICESALMKGPKS